MSLADRQRKRRQQQRRLGLDLERERDLEADADAEYKRNEAEYVAWLNRQWNAAEGYDEPDPAYDPSDPGDRLEVEGGLL